MCSIFGYRDIGGMTMRTRNMKYDDYGFSVGEERRLKAFCQEPGFPEGFLLLESAVKANANISNDLYYSITSGVSYDKLANIKYILISRPDFYGYQRKTLAILKEALIEVGRYPF